MSSFDSAFDQLIGLEGGYSDDEHDPGNWTGGEVGVGELKGTNWGISAKSYPHLDIKNLSRDDAKEIYRSDFWQKMRCDSFNPGIGVALFKEGVNLGADRAAMILQGSLKVQADGVIGPITIGVATSSPPEDVLVNFLAECLLARAGMKNFPRYGRGWFRRTVRTAVQAKL
ncbi:MAG: secretion activator protein [Proteobacteria bacterium]|nr:secretion activator protein [Pseudomonadota bacterium]MBS2011036.1 secretion activator protein [Cyanobacteria bacterium SZAS TMP-1]